MLLRTLFMGLAFVGSLAMADIKTVDVPDMQRSAQADGWHQLFSGDLGLNLTDMDNVAGKKDGLNSTFNLGLKYNANLYSGSSEWRNTVTVGESLNRTPSYDGTVHATDELKLESIYLYNIEGLDWVSPYVSFIGTTNIFKAYDYQQTAKAYGGAATSGAVSRFQLLDAFGIVNLKETVGALFKIMNEKDMKLEGRFGFGANQIMADDQLSIVDDSGATVLVGELSDVSSIGLEAGLEMTGDVMEDRVDYKLYAKAYAPLDISSDDKALEDVDTQDAISTELGARLNFKLVDWASIVYQWKHLKEPLIIDGPQITQDLLLNVGYKFDSRAKNKKK